MGKKGYNDAGARVKALEGVDFSKEESEIASRELIERELRRKEGKASYENLKSHLKNNPEVKKALKKLIENEDEYGEMRTPSLIELVNDFDNDGVNERRKSGVEKIKSKKIETMEDLKRAKKVVDQLDEE